MNYSSLNIRKERETNNALITQLYEAQRRLDKNFQKGCLELFKKIQTAFEKLPRPLKVEFEISNDKQTLFVKKGYAGVEINLYDNGTFSTSSCHGRREGRGKHSKVVFYLVRSSVEDAPAWGNTAPAEEIEKHLASIMDHIRLSWQKPVTEEQILKREEEWASL